jgi:type VI protein secretion system component VasF
MKQKSTLIIACVCVLAIAAFMYWSAQIARKKSDNLLEQFKQINKSLDSTNKLLERATDTSIVK